MFGRIITTSLVMITLLLVVIGNFSATADQEVARAESPTHSIVSR